MKKNKNERNNHKKRKGVEEGKEDTRESILAREDKKK